MNKFLPKLTLAFIIASISFITYKSCYFVAEKYFFDKFFLEKSILHGYWPVNRQDFSIASFKERTKDLIMLSADSPNILGKSTDNFYKIAVFGDSYTWGQGITNDHRYVKLLEDKLNHIRPTKVYSLAMDGDSTLDYYDSYQKFTNNNQADIYIFALVYNDALIKGHHQNYTPKTLEIINICQQQFPNFTLDKIFDFYEYLDQGLTIDQINYKLYNLETSAWSNPINLCIVDQTLKSLPKTNAIYFITSDYLNNNPTYKKYIELANSHNKFIINSSSGRAMPLYARYWQGDVFNNLRISQKEGHPNNIANQMYADILFNEITSDLKWNFKL